MPGLESKIVKVIIKGVYLTLFFCLTLSPCFAQTELPIASATASSSNGSSYPPSKAIDNNYTTYWAGGNRNAYWWLKLDLGQSYYLSQISIWWHKDSGSTNYNIQTSTDGTTWNNLYTGLSSKGGSVNPYKLTYNLSGLARYVQLYINQVQGVYPVIYEVKLYGELQDTTPPTGTIKINNDAQYTNSTTVTLNLSASDSGTGMGQGAQMRFSNDNSTWSSPEAYTTSKSWTLTSGDGTKTVYVKFKDVAGNWSGAYSDIIILDTTLPTGSILINNGDASTDNWDVLLNLSATNTGSGMGQGSQMKFSNDNSISSDPESYSTTKFWRLSDGFGVRTVYVRFKDAAGNWSSVYSDTINVLNVPKERIHIYLNGKRIAMQENDKKYFFHSDHLGSTSVVTNESGQLVRYVEYKPFGDSKVDGGSISIKKKFTGKELDESTGLYDYSARQYDPKIGRFITADPIDFSDAGIKVAGGKDLQTFLANPQNLNRYTYCLNNPLRYIDPDGLLTIFIHGTRSSPKMFSKDFIEVVKKTFNEKYTVSLFTWSGKDNNEARVSAAQALVKYINEYKFELGEQLNIVGHSHGGNVAFLTSQRKLQRGIDNLVALGTPIREYKPKMDNIGHIYNVYSPYDKVQTALGGGKHKIFGNEWGKAGRILNGAENIEVPVDKGPIGSHGYLHTAEAWNTYIQRKINKNGEN